MLSYWINSLQSENINQNHDLKCSTKKKNNDDNNNKTYWAENKKKGDLYNVNQTVIMTAILLKHKRLIKVGFFLSRDSCCIRTQISYHWHVLYITCPFIHTQRSNSVNRINLCGRILNTLLDSDFSTISSTRRVRKTKRIKQQKYIQFSGYKGQSYFSIMFFYIYNILEKSKRWGWIKI